MSVLRSTSMILPATLVATLAASPAQAADYRVEFDGAPKAIADKLDVISTLAKAERELPTRAALARAANADIDAIEQALRAAGFYAGRASYKIITTSPDGAEHPRPLVAFQIAAGPAFEIVEYEINYRDEGPADRPATLSALGLEGDGRASGAALQSMQQAFLTKLWDAGYPSARLAGRRAEADLQTGKAGAVFYFESGPRAVFNGLTVSGETRTRQSFLEALATWEEGALYERSKLIDYRDALAQTGLFSEIDVAPGAPGPDGNAPVIVTLAERKRRTIGLGGSFSTAEGPGGRLFFEYRNLLGAGERARAEIAGTAVEQSLALTIDKPMPTLPGALFGELSLQNETTDAFDARTITLGAGLSKHWLDDRLETRAAGAFETSRISQNGERERTYLLSFPLSVIWDTEDDPLFLAKGARITSSLTPYTGSDHFTRAEISARSRVNFAGERATIAARARFGSIFGSAFSDIPLNQRFFSGGGSSVRGFDFQEAGPLDDDGNPTGGRSVIEGAIEGRFNVTSAIQLAAFADAGNISPNSMPDVTGDYFIGVGGGVRYMTPIGPLRLDGAIPLERRDSDAAFQIFVSLGQAF